MPTINYKVAKLIMQNERYVTGILWITQFQYYLYFDGTDYYKVNLQEKTREIYDIDNMFQGHVWTEWFCNNKPHEGTKYSIK